MSILTQKTILIPVSLIFLSGVTLLLITAFWKYGLAGLSPTERIATKMCRFGKLAGISKTNYQTVEEYSLLLATRYPLIKTDIYKITNAHMIEKYSGKSHDLIDVEAPWAIIKSYILKDFIKRIFRWTQKNDTDKSN